MSIASVARAHDRLVRVMAFALGSASAILFALNSPAIAAGLATYSPVWTLLTLLAVATSTIVLSTLFARISITALGRWSAVHAIALLLALATLPLAVVPGNDALETPWIVNVLVVGAAAAAVGFRPPVAWAYLAALLIDMVITISTVTQASVPEKPYQDALFNAFYLTLCFSLALATHRAGRLLDQAAAAAVREARSVAVSKAKAIEDGYIHALVHDSVLVALLTFSRGSPEFDARAGEQARRALAAIDRAEDGNAVSTEPASQRELAWALQALTTEIDPNAAFRSERIDAQSQVPAPVGVALREATGEALRNSVVHGGNDDGVMRLVHVRFTEHSVAVDVIDDGRGFDPARVRPERLGLKVGILNRMRSLVGGSATVTSSVGNGTRVALRWEQNP